MTRLSSIKQICSFQTRIISIVTLIVFSLCTAARLNATVLTWTGGAAGGNRNWNNGNNWDTLSIPQNNDSLVFPASIGGQITNNLSGRTFAQISFNGVGGSFFVYGNPITLTGGIVQSSSGGANTVYIDITLATNNQTFSVTGSGIGSALTIAGDINLNGRNLTVNVTDVGNTLTLSGAVSGTGNITRNTGSGGLRFSGSAANSYAGVTTINSGYISAIKPNGIISIPGDIVIGNNTTNADGFDTLYILNDNQTSASSDITINPAGLLDLNGNTNTVSTITFVNGGRIETGTGRLQIGGTVSVNGGTVSNTPTINGNLYLGTATRTFDVDNLSSAVDLDINAVISGGSSGSPLFIPAGIIKSGAGVMRFSGANTYGGLTTINEGQLTANNNKALAGTGLVLFGSSGTVVNSNAVLLLNDAHITNEVLTLNSTNPGGALQDNLTGDWTGDIILATNVVIEASSALGIDGQISGPGGFTKISTSTLTLLGTNQNTYAGTTIVNSGTLLLSRTGSGTSKAIPGDLVINNATVRLGANWQIYSPTNSVTMASSALFDLAGFDEWIGPLDMTAAHVTTGTGLLYLSGDITVNASAIAMSTISGNVRLFTSNRTITCGDGTFSPDLEISANISSGGAFGIIKNGLGEVGLTGTNNNYSGATTVNDGILRLENSNALGNTNTTATVNSGGMIALFGSVAIGAKPLVLNGSGAPYGALAAGFGSSSWAGDITLGSSSTVAAYSVGSSLTLSGKIGGSGNLTTEGPGTITFAGNVVNDYVGNTLVNSGTLRLNKTIFDGSIPAGNLTVRGTLQNLADNQINNNADVSVSISGLYNLNGNLERFDQLSGFGSVALGVGGSLYAGHANGTSTFNGIMSGSGQLTKVGTGTLTLKGDNTYTGLTQIDFGSLIVDGSQPQSPVFVNASGTLGGSGTIGNMTVSGNLAPGASPATLTCSNVAFTATGDYFVELTGPTAGVYYDQLNVRGTNALGNAALHLAPNFTTPVSVGQKFTIINNDLSEANTGAFAGLPEGSTITAGNYTFRISYADGSFGNDVVLTLTNVPGAVVNASSSSGNGNRIIDANECNSLFFVVSNKTASPMTGVTAVLSTTNTGVLISQPLATYPNIAANGTGTNLTPFQLSTLPNFPCGSDIAVQLTVNSSAGLFTTTFVLETGEPAAVPNRYDMSVVTNIPDIGTIESTNVVAGFSGQLAKVTASLWLTHPIDSDLSISLISPDGVQVDLSSGNGSGANFGSACSPDASRTTFDNDALTSITAGASPFIGTFKPEGALASFVNGTANGNWRLRVTDSFAGSVGALRCWSLSLYPAECSTNSGACDTCLPPITGSITVGDLTQVNRISRDHLTATCGTPKTFISSFPGSFHYDVYTFTNTSPADACVTVLLTSACDVQCGAYLGSFDPSNITNNYIGDAGFSTGPGVDGLNGPTTFSCMVPAGAKFLVAVNETISGAGCGSYTLQISGLPCPPPKLNIQPVADNQARLFWSTASGGYLLESETNLVVNAWTGVTNEPIVSGGNYNVTNSSISPTNRFYRLHKP